MSDGSGPAKRRPVRSFVRREGRLTPGQQRALDELLPRYGIPYATEPVDLTAAFGRAAPCVVEIGFGNGDALLALAQRRPEANFLGIEVHRPGVGHLLRELHEHDVGNVRVICHDAVEVLRDMIRPDSLAAVHLFFPDPWPKKRHHKRRIVQPDFVALVAGRLARSGVLHMATDWEHYAQHMLETVTPIPMLDNLSTDGRYVERPPSRPVTKFERRGRRLGHGTWDLMFRRR